VRVYIGNQPVGRECQRERVDEQEREEQGSADLPPETKKKHQHIQERPESRLKSLPGESK
jgi:hypothetical protein